MGDIKLFRTTSNGVTELEGRSVAMEKSLQNLLEKNLDDFLGVTFLASEYSTGKSHGGRMDTLGIDENRCPVIIEYKRSSNQNVINQGLFYLDWLMDHKADLELLARKRLGPDIADHIEWSSPRLLCIAGDFTKYDQHAVQQIGRNIELMRYQRFEEELLMLELVNAVSTGDVGTTAPAKTSSTDKSVTDQLADADRELVDLFELTKEYLMSLGDDVQMKTLKLYVAFRRIKNFACVEVSAGRGVLRMFLKVSPDDVQLEDGFTRDVRNIGHWGTGSLEVTVRSEQDLERAKPLLERSYHAS